MLFLGFTQRYTLTRVAGFFFFAVHPHVNSIRLHNVPFCFTSVLQRLLTASRHKWWTERGAHAKWYSPNFIHQVVHLAHQPLVLLLKLDRKTKLIKNTLINTGSELNGATVQQRNRWIGGQWYGSCRTIWISSGESSSSAPPSSNGLAGLSGLPGLPGLSGASNTFFSTGNKTDNLKKTKRFQGTYKKLPAHPLSLPLEPLI